MKLVDDPDAALWLDQIRGDPDDFEWDAGNRPKLAKHHVRSDEVVSMFRSPILLAGRIVQPAHDEARWLVLGESDRRRKLALILTRRHERLRVLSCRPMRRNERKLHEEATREKGQVGNA